MENEQLIILIAAAGTALAGAIGVLYKQIVSLTKDHSDIRHKLGKLEGEHDGVRELSNRVLDSVHRAVLDRSSDRSRDRDR